AHRPAPVDSLWAYESSEYFVCFPGERTPSTSTNAHILSALTASRPSGARAQRAIGKIASWLREQQEPDGSWSDKWHASPYYATVCCVAALAPLGDTATQRAVRWVLDTQRADGSWGRWAGTPEETAYAIQILLSASMDRDDPATTQAVARGCAFLSLATDDDHPPLWHDKDLYAPITVIKAERLAALRMAAQDPRVCMLVD